MSVTFFLGAGFSYMAGCPLAKNLFEVLPERVAASQQKLADTVVRAWRNWVRDNPGSAADEFIREVYQKRYLWEYHLYWGELLEFLSLTLARPFVEWKAVSGRLRARDHDIYAATIGPTHELFWSSLFNHLKPGALKAVITTNYDILAERGLRPKPTPRRKRPGFNYGIPGEIIIGRRGYPISGYRTLYQLTGSVPLLKLHGSLNWGVDDDKLKKYGDCRPALKGNAALLPPIEMSEIPCWLAPTWEAAARYLRETTSLCVVGYSLPEYDRDVRELLAVNVPASCQIHVFDPQSPLVADRFRSLLARRPVQSHPGLPECVDSLASVVACAS